MTPFTQPTEPTTPSVLCFSTQPGQSYDRAFERALGSVERHRSALGHERAEAERILTIWRRHPAAQRRLLAWNYRGPWTWSLASALVDEAETAYWQSHPEAVALAALAAEVVRRIEPAHYAETIVTDLQAEGWSLHGRALLTAGERPAAESIEQALANDPAIQRSPHALHLRALRLADQNAQGAARGLRRTAAAFRHRGETFHAAIARIDHGLLLTRRVAQKVVRGKRSRAGRLIERASAMLTAGYRRLDRQRAPLAARRAEEALGALSAVG